MMSLRGKMHSEAFLFLCFCVITVHFSLFTSHFSLSNSRGPQRAFGRGLGLFLALRFIGARFKRERNGDSRR
jgi:hypothetical protein